MELKDFVPPILVRAARKLRPRTVATPMVPHLSETVYASYAEAAAACSEFGYEQNDLVDVICRKTAIYRDKCASEPAPMVTGVEMAALVGLGLARPATGEVSVLDFGGACGAHYFRVKSIVGDSLRLNWRVVETPTMAQRAQELANSELSFFSSLTAAIEGVDGIDLLFSSSALQCVPDPYRTLQDLLECNAEYLALVRVGLTDSDRDYITIHETSLAENGPGPLPPGMKDGPSRYPFTYPARARIEGMLSKDYRIMLRSPEASGVLLAHSDRILGLSYVAHRRPGNTEFSHALVGQLRDVNAATQASQGT